jgi:hypothetical protein
LTDLIADTILAHGLPWTMLAYARRGLPQNELDFWFGTPPVRRAIRARMVYAAATGQTY